MTTDLTKAPGNNGAIQKAQAPVSRLQNEEQEDVILPRVHLYQGLPTEKQLYGPHEAGELINTLTQEAIPTKRFVPVFGWNEWIRFRDKKDGGGIEYKTRNREEVPPEDLEWDRVNGGKPKAMKVLNWAVLFEGFDFPLVLSFKATSIKAGQTLNTLEKLRGKKGPGLYALDTKERSNSQGAWLTPLIRPAGDPTLEMKALAIELFNSLSGAEIVVEGDGDGGGGFDPDNDIPV